MQVDQEACDTKDRNDVWEKQVLRENKQEHFILLQVTDSLHARAA